MRVMGWLRGRKATVYLGIPPAEQEEVRRKIREADRSHYSSHDFKERGAQTYARVIVPKELLLLVHDTISRGDPTGPRNVTAGIHDVRLEQAVARVLDERYDRNGSSLRQGLPADRDDSLETRQLTAVMLLWSDGPAREADRVARVVLAAELWSQGVNSPENARRRVVATLITERRALGHTIRLALASSWTGQREAVGVALREAESVLDPAGQARLAAEIHV